MITTDSNGVEIEYGDIVRWQDPPHLWTRRAEELGVEKADLVPYCGIVYGKEKGGWWRVQDERGTHLLKTFELEVVW